MASVLMVAEKPSLAKSLAEILSYKQCWRRKSMCSACDVYEFDGSFHDRRNTFPAHFKMTSVCGHVKSLDFLPKYNKWDTTDPGDLFSAETKKKEAIPDLRICNFMRSEGAGMDYLVLWLDCDKEGENICFEVIEEVKDVMRVHRNPNSQVIFRARFSSITEKAIFQAFNNLTEPNWNEARSVDARQELDLRIGCAFTRFQTTSFQSKYTGLNDSVISYGPCQTPTLGFCVHRHDEIQQFKPEKYWRVEAKVKLGGAVLSLESQREHIFDSEVGMLLVKAARDCKQAVVESVLEKIKTKSPPQALHTVELLRSASSRLHIGPKQAMDVAERLYIEGYISYPRTETTRYAVDFDFTSPLSELSRNPQFDEYARFLLRTPIKLPSGGTDIGDHPPITPMKNASRDQLSDTEWRVYEFIARHFLATLQLDDRMYEYCVKLKRVFTCFHIQSSQSLYPDCKYKVVEVQLSLGSESFQWSGVTPVTPGFTEVYPWQAIHGTETEINWMKGQQLDILEVQLTTHETTPPGYLTESELISLMEKHGIGTDASIPVHIENICSRNYVRVDSGRRLIPTKLGIVLVHGYHKIDPELVLPTMRSAIEEQLNMIAKGQADFESVLSHTLELFQKKFEYFRENVGGMDELFEASFSSVAESGRPISRCGKCRRFMKYIAAKPHRLYCMHCDETYSLPPGGTIKLYKELKCPLDEFELLLYSGGPKGQSFLVCPYCYNEPPFSGSKKSMSCSLCTHQSCPYAMPQNCVGVCSECEHGILVLEPHFHTGGPAPKWRIACNNMKCKEMVDCFEGSTDVQSCKEICDCGSYLLTVDLSKVTHLPENVERCVHKGCWRCDIVLSALLIQPNWRGHWRRGRGRRPRRH